MPNNGQHPKGAPTDSIQRVPERTADKEERKRQRKLAALEEEIAMLETELKQLSEEMTAAGVQGDGKRIAALNLQYAEVDDMLASRYTEWTALAR